MKQNHYDETFKSEAVKLTLSGELSYLEIAKNLGVNYKTLCHGIHQTMSNPKSSENKEKTPTKQDYQTLERQNSALQ